ncbi:MAG TPA: 2-thiouracil desulfurase family protein, partial [Methanocorpusculum sp.]|nr:2-thiouracil desulfurase family protein [Methanocorpusculum sp.]
MYVLISPCILNEELRANGITDDSDRIAWKLAVERCKQFKIDIVQLPCPEKIYLGVPRDPCTFLNKLNTPEFIRIIDKLQEDVEFLIKTKGEAPIAIVGVNSSPSCGVSSTYYGDNKTNEAGIF